MSKKIKVNISVEKEVWELAEAMNLNRSEICNKALKLKVGLDDKEESLLRRKNELRLEEKLIDDTLADLKAIANKTKEFEKPDDVRIMFILNTLTKFHKRNGYIGRNRIANLCLLQNVNQEEIFKRLPDDILKNLVNYEEL